MSLLNNVLGSLNPFSWLRGRQRNNDVFESVTELQDEDEEPSTFSDALEDVGTENLCADSSQHEPGTIEAKNIPQQINVEGREMQMHLSEEFTLVGNANEEKSLLCSRMDEPLSLSSGDNENQPVACVSVAADIGTDEPEQSKTPEPVDEMPGTNVAVTADTEKSEEMLSKISTDTTPAKVRRKIINIEPRKFQEEGQSLISCAVDKLYGASDPQETHGVAWRPPLVLGAVGETSTVSTMPAKKRKASNDLTADDEEIRFICEGPCAKQVKKIKKVKRPAVATSTQNPSSKKLPIRISNSTNGMLRRVIFLATTVTVISLPTEKRQVRIGMVPIFDARITNEPITFTFTTVPPAFTSTSYPVTSYPVQIKSTEKLPTLIPMDHKESYVQTNYNNFNEKWQYTPRPQPYTTPIYNQAQYFKAIQSGYGSNKPMIATSSPYDAAWVQIGDSWHQMKSTLTASGIERDWRRLWGKLTGAVEPFMSEFSEQLGKMANIFLRQQQSRLERETPRPSGTPFWLFRGDRHQQQNLAATQAPRYLGSATP